MRFLIAIILMPLCFMHPGVAMANAAAPVLLDRLVLEVNKVSFTQRQFELYMALKSILEQGTAGQVELVTERNWSSQLQSFKNEMLVEQEASRLSSVQPNRKMVEASKRMVDNKRQGDLIFSSFLHRVRANDTNIRRTLALVMRVKGFVISRQRQRTGRVAAKQRKGVLDKDADWFQDLERRVPYRIYEGARKWQPVQLDNLGPSTSR